MPIKRRTMLWAVPALLLVAGGIAAASMMQPPPADLDLSTTKLSDAGNYTIAIAPDVGKLEVGPIHTWTVTLTSPDGAPVESAEIRIDGGMPQHGHGLPTAPEVTEYLGDGRYLLEGMKFNMSGWWVLNVHVDGPAADAATFNVML
jgi:hypothetical protein